MFTPIAPCRSAALISKYQHIAFPTVHSRLRTNSSPTLPKLVSSHEALSISPQDFKQMEFITFGQPQIHLMRGFSPYVPDTKVIGAVRTKVDQFAVVSLPQLEISPHIQPRTISSNKNFLTASFSSLPDIPVPMTVSRPLKVPQAQEAFFVLDLDRVRAKADLWNRCFPTVKAHYAVKANPNPAIIRLMAQELNINFDCASQSEIEAVLQQGVNPSRIVFANPCKSLSHIAYARRHGVLRTTFDSESELYKIKAVHPHAEVILRIWVDDKDAQCQLSNKYGAHLHEAMELLNVVNKLNLDCIGVSFHVGSGASPMTFKSALSDARKLFDAAARKGIHMRLLDIGGGFPGTDQDDISLPYIAKLVRPILARDFPGVELISEPGRFFCSEAQTLATQIIGKRLRAGGTKGRGEVCDSRREYYINDGLYQSFNCILYDHSILLKESDEDHEGKRTQGAIVPKYPSLIFGQTCDGLDTICKDIHLPELRVGDWLVVPNMGAYTNGASSSFNGFPLNSCVVLDSNKPQPELI